MGYSLQDNNQYYELDLVKKKLSPSGAMAQLMVGDSWVMQVDWTVSIFFFFFDSQHFMFSFFALIFLPTFSSPKTNWLFCLSMNSLSLDLVIGFFFFFFLIDCFGSCLLQVSYFLFVCFSWSWCLTSLFLFWCLLFHLVLGFACASNMCLELRNTNMAQFPN